MIITTNTRIINEAYTEEGITFRITEQDSETRLMITWANGEDALDYEIRLTGRDKNELLDLLKTA